MKCALLDWMVKRTGMPAVVLSSLIRTGPNRYKSFYIPKRSGRGVRLIAQPARELKELQRLAVCEYFKGLPVHTAAHGYVKGRSIKTNAAAHKRSGYLLKLDVKSFFPSLTPSDLAEHLRLVFDGHEDVLSSTLSGLFFWRPKGTHQLQMCIGAPSSPFLSNTLLYDFDERASEYCRTVGVRYTRYSDDLTFSTAEPNVLASVRENIEGILVGLAYPRLTLNNEKTVYTSAKHRRVITGVTISSEGRLSLGRERKRLLRAMVFRSNHGRLSPEELAKLTGWLNYARDIEPEFVQRLLGEG